MERDGPPPTPPAAGSARGRIRGAVDDLLAVLGRLIPIARGLERLTRALAWSTLVTAGVLVVAVLVFSSVTSITWFAWLLFVVVVVVPGVVLLLFSTALAEVLELPAALQQMPEVTRDHAQELAQLLRETREGPRLRGLGRGLFRSLRLVLEAHEDIPGYGSVLRLASWPFLIASAAAAVAAPFVIWVSWMLVILVVVF